MKNDTKINGIPVTIAVTEYDMDVDRDGLRDSEASRGYANTTITVGGTAYEVGGAFVWTDSGLSDHGERVYRWDVGDAYGSAEDSSDWSTLAEALGWDGDDDDDFYNDHIAPACLDAVEAWAEECSSGADVTSRLDAAVDEYRDTHPESTHAEAIDHAWDEVSAPGKAFADATPWSDADRGDDDAMDAALWLESQGDRSGKNDENFIIIFSDGSVVRYICGEVSVQHVDDTERRMDW